MSRCVIVTRPEPGVAETMRRVMALGWHAIACPMLRITCYPALEPLDVDAVAVTSANALPALAAQRRDLPIKTVGHKTAERARNLGFTDVEAAGGDAASLARLCAARGLHGARLLLVCGQGYGVDWACQTGALRREVYRAQPERTLTEGAQEALRRGVVEAVMFYSGETAAAFMAACHADLQGVRAICLSEAIAARLPQDAWKSIALLSSLGRSPESASRRADGGRDGAQEG